LPTTFAIPVPATRRHTTRPDAEETEETLRARQRSVPRPRARRWRDHRASRSFADQEDHHGPHPRADPQFRIGDDEIM